VGRESAVTAAQTRVLAESLDKQQRAASASAAATLASAKADRILADASDDAIRATVEQRIATEKLGKASAVAAGSEGVGALAGGPGIGGPGVIGLLAAGALAAAPVIVTLGAGLGGLGLAALAAGKGSRQLRAELKPLKTDFAAFGKTLRPTVLEDFNAAISAARPLLRGLEPVTKSTGAALAVLLGEVGAEFRSTEWQQFFQFMGATAAEDVRLLGSSLLTLLKTLPPVLEELQPVAVDFLAIAAGAAKIVHGATAYQASLNKTTQHENVLAKTTDFLRTLLFAPGAGLYQALKLVGVISSDTAGKQKQAGAAAVVVARQVNAQAAAYIHALTPLENYIGAQITEANDLKALNVALRASHGAIGLKTQAERNSFSAAQTYITDTIAQGNAALGAHKGIDAQIASIDKALPRLEHVRGKTAAYRDELNLLKGILNKLRREKRIQELVTVSGTGVWTIHPGHGLPGGTAGGPFAAGGLVRAGSGPTADDVVARVSKGELVVPARMVSAGLVDHLRGALPGFAAGGIVPSYKGGIGGLRAWTAHDRAATVHAITAGIARAMASGFAGAGGFGIAPHGPLQSYARKLLAAYGWSAMWPQFNDIVMRESGWNVYARNPSSGAYGIPQALPAGKMASAGADWATNGFTQLRWMMAYIRSRWGDPWSADLNERTQHWYGSGLRGGIFRSPTLIGVGERGPERVDVTPAGRGAAGPLVHVEQMVVQDSTDVQLTASRLSFLVASAGFGS
jgi:hypothetical protein